MTTSRFPRHFGNTLILAASMTFAACGPPPEDEAVSVVDQPIEPWTVTMTAIEVIKNLYNEINWFNCTFGATCPESDAHREATRVINTLEADIGRLYVDDQIANVNTLLDRAAADFAKPDLLLTTAGTIEEQGLVNQARDLYNHFRQVLLDTDPASELSVNIAYTLAPFFNVLAALSDNIGQLASKNPAIFLDNDWVNAHRRDTLAVNYALVGAQSLWFDCGPTQVSTVQSFTNSFATKKLWRKFASYTVNRDSNGDIFACNPFNAVTGASICNRIKCSFHGTICHAGANFSDADVYRDELPKILAKMNRDPTVLTVRAAMEKLVGIGAERGAALVWEQPSGEVDLWDSWSATSYKPTWVDTGDSAWHPIRTGDFNRDGQGDILWHNDNDGTIGIGEIKNNQLQNWIGPGSVAPAGIPYVGDLDGDGVSDIMWDFSFGVGTPGGTVTVSMTTTWMMDPDSAVPRVAGPTTQSHLGRLQGIGNFDNDSLHRADAIYRDLTTGLVNIAFSGGSEVTMGIAPNDWQIKAIGDFNRDGFSDILWYNVNSGGVAVWTLQGTAIIDNVGLGTVDPSWGWSIQGVADIDHDGISDLVWQHWSGVNSYWILSGPGSVREYTPGIYVGSSKFIGSVERGPAPPANPQASPVPESFCGLGSGRLRNPGFAGYETAWWNTFDGGRGTLLGDVDRDMKQDLITLGEGTIQVARSTGSGFGNAETWFTDGFWSSTPTWGDHGVLAGDVDGDGDTDLVRLEATAVCTLYSNGVNAFAENSLCWIFNPVYGNQATLLGDVNGDRKADLVMVNDTSVTVQLSQSSSGSSGTWSSVGMRLTASNNRHFFLADVNGDGFADLVGSDEFTVKVMISNGSNGFANAWLQDVRTVGGHALFAGDVNGDGKADLVSLEDGYVRVYRSSSTFFGRAEYWWGNTFNGNHWNLLGDVDGNMKADIVAGLDGSVGMIRSQ